MQLYYQSEFNNSNNFLTPEESKHCIKVMRSKIGDSINVMDGKGNFFNCEIEDANHKKCVLKIIDTKHIENKYKVHIAIAPTKNIDRLEWFLEKSTEMGIKEITPILCNHSERKIIKPERLKRVLVSASKQSLKPWLPKLNDLITFSDFIQQKHNGQLAIAHCYDSEKKLLKDFYNEQEEITILIGPEGDFSPNEVELAIKNGFSPISLGDERLRTETAATLACAIPNIINCK